MMAEYNDRLLFCMEPPMPKWGVTRADVSWMIEWRKNLMKERPDLREQIVASIRYLKGWVMP